MAVKVPGNWLIYIYASDTRIGAIAENNAGEVPLTNFSGVVSGIPTTPDWLELEIYSMYPADIGDRVSSRRAGGVTVVSGRGQWGGKMNLLEYDFNTSLDKYFATMAQLRKQYTYIWFNDYDGGEYLISDAVNNAMRIAFTAIPEPDRDDAYIDVEVEWRKYCEGL
jgi:hypothetical protein